MKPPSLLHVPDRKHLAAFLFLGGMVTSCFCLVYGGTNFLTGLHHYRVRLHLDAELAIPFVPEAVFGYLSIYAVFGMAPFVVRTKQELRRLARTLVLVILIAAICFLVFPGELLFAPQEPDAWAGLIHFAKEVALSYNLAPSLHVALSVVCLCIYARQAGVVGTGLLWLWAAVIGLSTLLLHQHYLLDVVTGFALALAAVQWSYGRPLQQPNERK
jgi:membrane-associated phospholipid phosphatase